MTELLHFHFSLSCIEEGKGNALQYSCLENPRDSGAAVWWAAVYGVAQSRTRLKQLSSSSGSSSPKSLSEFLLIQQPTPLVLDIIFLIEDPITTVKMDSLPIV